MTGHIKTYATPRFIRTLIGLITAEQLSIAAGTALLALAGKNLTSPALLFALLGTYAVVSQLPHFILIFLRRVEMVGYADMYFEFLQQRLLSQAGRPRAWRMTKHKDTFLTAIGPEADNFLTAIAFSQFDLYSYVLNIVLSTLAIALVIDIKFLVAFALSSALSFAIYRGLHEHLDKLVSQEQTAKLEFSAYVLRAWDNVFLANRPVELRYRSGLNQRFQTSRRLAGQSASWAAALVFLLSVAASVPVLGLNFILASRHVDDPGILAALMVTLPRQLQILGVFRSLFQQITNLKVFTTRFETAVRGTQVGDTLVESMISLEHVKIDGAQASSLKSIVDRIHAKKSGRMLITGSNGSGKSSLLVYLNSELDSSFYVPTSPQLEIGHDLSSLSSGQRMLKHLEFIEQEDLPVILLDEWDANLDEGNQAAVDEQLERLSRTRWVIEVRH